jgi:hypothetical protein
MLNDRMIRKRLKSRRKMHKQEKKLKKITFHQTHTRALISRLQRK